MQPIRVVPAVSILVVIVALGVMLTAASAATINVPADYGTIQAAVDAAANGDVVVVAPGTYAEQVDFATKAITLASTDPTDPAVVAETIIDGGGSGPVVLFENGETATSIIEGFTITGGDADTAPNGVGGGILCDATSPIIRNNVITRNGPEVYSNGGGIGCVNGAAPQITNNTFSYNAAEYGGAIYMYDSAGAPSARKGTGPVITGNTFYGNVAQYGGVIYCEDGAFSASNNNFGLGSATNPVIPAAVAASKAKQLRASVGMKPTKPAPFARNSKNRPRPAQARAAAPSKRVQADKGGASKAKAVVAYGGNGAYDGGAIYLDQASATLDSNIFVNNGAYDYGGAIYMLYAGTLTCQNNVFDRNLSYDEYGGAIYAEGSVDDQPTLTFAGDVFTSNQAAYGGGLYLDTANATFTDCTFDRNLTESEAGAVYACSDADAPSTLAFSGCTITHNSGEYGGAIYIQGASDVNPYVINATFDSCTFTDNVAEDGYGGAISLQYASASIDECAFTGNISDYYGGGLYVSEARIHLTNSSFTGNACGYSDGYGGAIEFEGNGPNPSTIPAVGAERDNISYIENCSFTRNKASYYGGALYSSSGYLEVRGCQFIENSTYEDGGAVDWEASDGCLFENNLFAGNSTTYEGGAVYINAGDENTNIWRYNTFRGNLASAIGGSGVSGSEGGAVSFDDDCTFHGNILRNNWSAAKGGGIHCDTTYNQNIYNNTFVGNAALYGGGLYAYAGYGQLSFSNNIVAFNDNGGGIYTDGARTGFAFNDVYGNKGGNWRGTITDLAGVDGNISVDPLFVNRVRDDFRLKSVGGHWDDVSGSWVRDRVTSRCIDAGDPMSDFSAEPAPNGRRINLGFDAGLATASKSSMFAVVSFQTGTDGTSRTQPMTFAFLANMVPDSVEQKFSFVTASAGLKSPAALVWVDRKKATFQPPTLAAGEAYQVIFAAGSRRQDGTNVLWGETFDITAGQEPVVLSTTPADEASNVNEAGAIVITFDQVMRKKAAQDSFLLAPEWRSGGLGKVPVSPAPVAGTFSWSVDGKTMTFTPSTSLADNTVYVCRIGRVACSAVSNIVQPYVFSFDTGASPSPALAVTAAAATVGNGSVQLTVNLAAAATVSARVLNMAGVEVAVLAPSTLSAGTSTLLWNGKSKSGTSVPSGRYLINLNAKGADGSQVNCMVPLAK